jgi:N-methylhydantoinase A
VTDANVVLGYINPEAIAGSTLRINRQAAVDVVEHKLAQLLKLDLLRAAYGVTQVANAAMMRALRAVSTERGRDPREFTLVAFGGSGPIHAIPLAESLGITRVLVPLFPGLFSALGLLLADYRHDYVRTIAMALDKVNLEELVQQYEAMEVAARKELLQEGVAQEAIRFERQIDLKYGYQVSELPLPFPSSNTKDLREELTRLFVDAHKQAFGYDSNDVIEVVNLRLRALASAGNLRFSDLISRVDGQPSTGTQSRDAYFGPAYGTQHTPIRRRADIITEQVGPLIVEEPDTTVVVPPGWKVQKDNKGNLILLKK